MLDWYTVTTGEQIMHERLTASLTRIAEVATALASHPPERLADLLTVLKEIEADVGDARHIVETLMLPREQDTQRTPPV